MEFSALTTKAAVRKASGIPSRMLSRVLRLAVAEQDFASAPPVLANSFPKSGTHLLLQILRSFPRSRYFYNFIASAPARPNVALSTSAQLQTLDGFLPREVVPAHLFFARPIAQFVSERHFVHFFIYRDPRDVCVSEVQYLTKDAKHHSLHAAFVACPDDEERLTLAIKGLPQPSQTADYPDIASRFRLYRDWIGRDDVCAVRYEELRGDRLKPTIARMLAFYRDRTGYDFDFEAAEKAAILSIAPQRSHTFRSGQIGSWQKSFTEAHKRLMKDLAGSLLIDLGYETGWDW